MGSGLGANFPLSGGLKELMNAWITCVHFLLTYKQISPEEYNEFIEIIISRLSSLTNYEEGNFGNDAEANEYGLAGVVNENNLCGICKMHEGDGSEYPTCWDCKVKMGLTGESVLTKKMSRWIEEADSLLSYNEMNQEEFNRFINQKITLLSKLTK